MPDIIDGSIILQVARWSLLLLAAATPLAMAGESLGDIEFFGYQGFDVAKIRAALPVHEGGEFSQQTAVPLVREAVAAAIGQQPTDVSTICCDELGNRLLFIGLPGSSYKSFVYHPKPFSKDRLPRGIIRLYSQLDRAMESAVHKGGDAAEEDDSNGYALIKDPQARAAANGRAPVGIEARARIVTHTRVLRRRRPTPRGCRCLRLRAPISRADSRVGARRP